jgi:hypothetical protein
MHVFTFLGYRLEILIGDTWLGWCLAAALGAVCLGVSGLGLAVAIGAQRSRPLVSTLLAAALATGLAVVQVSRTRQELVELLVVGRPDVDPSQRARLVAEAISQSCETLLWTPGVLALAAVVVTLALAHQRTLTATRAVAAGAALLFAVCMVAVWVATNEYNRGFHCDHDCRYQALIDSLERLSGGRYIVAAVAGSAWIVSMMRWRRVASSAAPANFARASTAVLLVGLIAFVATRGMRSDAGHLVPRTPPHLSSCVAPSKLQATLPPAPPDCAARDAPSLELRPDGVFVDGSRMTGPEEAAEVFRNKAELWRQLNPGQHFGGVLVVLAPVHAKPQELTPWLAAVQRAGFGSFDVYMQVPVVALHTKTLGTLHKQTCCARPVIVEGTAKPLGQFASWGDLARATHRSALAVSLH